MIVRTTVASLCFALVSTAAHAQSTAGSIFGHGPAGSAVSASGSSGSKRKVTISSKGRYELKPLSAGTYMITLEKDGQVVDTRKSIPVTVGRGSEVDFACENDKCEASD